MRDDLHLQLDRGSYRWPEEGERIEDPPDKLYGPNGELWIQRMLFIDGDLVDFGVLLQLAGYEQTFHDVARFCVAHSNKHMHRWTKRSPQPRVSSGGPINSHEELMWAYYESQALYTNVNEEVERWGRR
ncbi:hypothetical protein ABLG96_13920 [Nakamurella sp. A5-74]|uniref:Uncharacterized protein n=1 Tax=Nakamurella sp. A5-74 TaxID=3158264 RepID=A0AAU8DKS0_9ACTN